MYHSSCTIGETARAWRVKSSKDDEESISRTMKCHGQVRKKQVGTGKVNPTVPTEPKGSREFHDCLGNITPSKQELFQCTSLNELCSALHYEEFEFIN